MLRRTALLLLVLLGLSACAQAPKTVSEADIDRLTLALQALDAGVDPEEAARAARISYSYPLQLREEYNVTDGPIIHNTKVNNGWRDRGLCVHWAEDMEKRLVAENFRTLEIHRAIAEASEWRIDHSSAVISARGETYDEGIVLDPWRYGGLLFWSPTREDPRYDWEPQMVVLMRKTEALKAKQKTGPVY